VRVATGYAGGSRARREAADARVRCGMASRCAIAASCGGIRGVVAAGVGTARGHGGRGGGGRC
jgi:hypothetical protein